jgi:transcriptional regulator with XRE-family HTH domain
MNLDCAAIRLAREQQGISLRELAKRCSLSAGFLSQAERGLAKPSLAALMTVCEVLDIPITRVIVDEREAPSENHAPREITRSGRRVKFQIGDAPVSFEHLSGDFPGRVNDLFLGRFPPDYRYPQVTHRGEEYGYVLEGTLILNIEGTRHVLRAGDSYHFSSLRPHSYETATHEGAVVWWGQTVKFIEGRGSGSLMGVEY